MMLGCIKYLSGAKLILIVHDIEALRANAGDGHSRENETELKLLGMADGIVSLNSVMTDWLHDHDINVSITNLNVWDYDNPNPINPMLPYTGSICFAGNLDKSTFLN